MDGLSGNYEKHSSVAGLLLGRSIPKIPERQGQVKWQVQVRSGVRVIRIRHVALGEPPQTAEQTRSSAIDAWNRNSILLEYHPEVT